VAGADANPYLVVAAILAAVADGMERAIDPGPPLTGSAYESHDPDFGSSWALSLDRLAGSAFYAEALGRPFLDVYLAVKRAERDRFHSLISPLEYEWYLEKV
jgi:glutamine synthetase